MGWVKKLSIFTLCTHGRVSSPSLAMTCTASSMDAYPVISKRCLRYYLSSIDVAFVYLNLAYILIAASSSPVRNLRPYY